MSEPSALREQITSAMIPVFAIDRALLKPEELRIIDELTTAVLAVILPHGKFLGDQLRDAEATIARVRALHAPQDAAPVRDGSPRRTCRECGDSDNPCLWPCPTIAALDQPAPAAAPQPTDARARRGQAVIDGWLQIIDYACSEEPPDA